jgi:hypothetical protein
MANGWWWLVAASGGSSFLGLRKQKQFWLYFNYLIIISFAMHDF